MKKGTTKKALLASVLALILCMTMLIGTTYAWFTDTAASAGNVIKSGTLDVELSWAEDPNGTWTDASASPIFNYELWEPGYTQIRYVRIANVGNLALKYQLNVVPTGTVSTTPEGKTLADVLDVYYLDVAKAEDLPTFADRSEFPGTELKKVPGTLADVVTATNVKGVLLPEGKTKTGFYSGEVYVVLALHMQEEAGNEYQNLAIGDTGFTVNLLATQYTYEEDSFDDQYDAMSDSDPLPGASLTNLDPATIGELPRYTEPTDLRTPDFALTFATTDTVADIQDKEYKDWIVDFRLSFNQDVEGEKIYVYGNYGTYGWIGDLLSITSAYDRTIAANEKVDIMSGWFNGCLSELGMSGINFHATYYEVVNEVGTFNCAMYVDEPAAGLVATLELVMTDPATGTTHVISTSHFTY